MNTEDQDAKPIGFFVFIQCDGKEKTPRHNSKDGWSNLWTGERFNRVPSQEEKGTEGFSIKQWRAQNRIPHYITHGDSVFINPDYATALYEDVFIMPTPETP